MTKAAASLACESCQLQMGCALSPEARKKFIEGWVESPDGPTIVTGLHKRGSLQASATHPLTKEALELFMTFSLAPPMVRKHMGEVAELKTADLASRQAKQR